MIIKINNDSINHIAKLNLKPFPPKHKNQLKLPCQNKLNYKLHGQCYPLQTLQINTKLTTTTTKRHNTTRTRSIDMYSFNWRHSICSIIIAIHCLNVIVTAVPNENFIALNAAQQSQPCDRTRRIFTESHGEFSDGPPGYNYTQVSLNFYRKFFSFVTDLIFIICSNFNCYNMIISYEFSVFGPMFSIPIFLFCFVQILSLLCKCCVLLGTIELC